LDESEEVTVPGYRVSVVPAFDGEEGADQREVGEVDRRELELGKDR
jgi:hypothetical protein